MKKQITIWTDGGKTADVYEIEGKKTKNVKYIMEYPFRNFLSFHHRIMANYLRKRGWVVFYLEESARNCNKEICWMELYKRSLR